MRIVGRFLGFMGRSDGSLQHRALRSGIWVAASSVSVTALTLVRGIILARLLGPEVFGVMAIALMATRLIETLAETGFGAALIHRQEQFERARDTAFTLMVMRGACLAAIAVAIAPWLATFYEQPVLEYAVAVMGLGLLCNGFQNINIVALQKELDFRRLSYMEQVAAVLTFVVTVALAYWLRNVWALVYAQVAASAITSILSFVMVPGRVQFRLDWQIAKELVGYGRFITGLAIVVFVSRELDNAVIGKVLGMHELGFYVTAYTLANIPSTYLSKLVAKVMFPLFSKLQSEPERLRSEYGRGMRMLAASVVPLSAIIAVLAPEIVRALYGERWMAAAAPLRILAIFGGCRALWMLNGYLYNAIGKPHIDFFANLARLVVMAGLLFPLTKAWGLVGASIAVTIPMVVQCVSGVFLTRRYIDASASLLARPMLEAMAHGLVLSLVLIAVKQVLGPHPHANLLILAATAGIAYAALNARTLQTLVATRRI